MRQTKVIFQKGSPKQAKEKRNKHRKGKCPGRSMVGLTGADWESQARSWGLDRSGTGYIRQVV